MPPGRPQAQCRFAKDAHALMNEADDAALQLGTDTLQLMDSGSCAGSPWAGQAARPASLSQLELKVPARWDRGRSVLLCLLALLAFQLAP